MMFSTGPAPDAKLIEERPDDVSAEAAVGAWMAGYWDARNKREYHIFPSDAEDLQPFYSNGFERGERDELHMQRINGRLPEQPKQAPQEKQPGRVELSEARMDVFMRRIHRWVLVAHRALKADSELLMVVAVLLVAAALAWGH